MGSSLTHLEAVKKAIKLTYQQGERSVNNGGACMYRGERGLKCAVGHLIDDEHYHQGLENKSVSRGCVLDALSKSGVATAGLHDCLVDIQTAHDESFVDFKKNFLYKLNFVAGRQELIKQALQELESEGLFKQ